MGLEDPTSPWTQWCGIQCGGLSSEVHPQLELTHSVASRMAWGSLLGGGRVLGERALPAVGSTTCSRLRQRP